MSLSEMSKAHFKLCRYCGLAIVALFLIFAAFSSLATAQAETRSLKLYFIHTNERAEIVFWRDGHYDQAGLKRLNIFLRDWRRNEPTNMDPRLFTLIWSVYQASGSHDYIHVVSAYRSPTTNNMLRLRSANSGVAKNSQHTLGHAMDFYLPDVKLAKLRAIGLKQEVGGVGYYPTSGSPFVHMDVGRVRHWPRMSRKELLSLFPDGKTMYIPSDGKPLAGYAVAKAEYQARNGAPLLMAATTPAKKRGFLASLFSKKETPQPAPIIAENKPVANKELAPAADGNSQSSTNLAALSPNDIPVPIAPPERGQAPSSEPEPEQASNTTELAYANIPVPDFKEQANLNQSLTAERGNQTQTAVTNTVAANEDESFAKGSNSENSGSSTDENRQPQQQSAIPIPQPRPENGQLEQNQTQQTGTQLAEILQNVDKGEPTIEADQNPNQLAAANSPTPKSEDDSSKVDVQTLVASNDSDIIPVPDDGGDEDEEEDNNISALDDGNREFDTTEPQTDQQTVASVVAMAKPAERAAKPHEDDINKIVAEVKPLESANTDPSQELRQIPNLVFLSGLEKKLADPNYAELTGKAINFRAVARVY